MRRHLLSLVLLTITLAVAAAERSANRMQQATLHLLNSANTKSVLSQPTLEVFSDGERFAIVSRDDRFPEIIAYGSGLFDIEQAPANVRWWFDKIQYSMECAIREGAPQRAARSYAPINPLMDTKWGQETPYNNFAPTIGTEKAPAGCVATAMAQIMNYQKYPASASFMGSYSVDGTIYRENVNSTYSWPYLLAYGTYLSSSGFVTDIRYSPDQGNDIAKLMRDCGYAVEMSYGINGSASYSHDVEAAYVEKFSYPQESVKFLVRDYYAEEEWMDMIHTELENDCPILYSGHSNASGGHAFVLHGMNANGLVYINWGWNGWYDGYYAIDALRPGGENFSEGEDMVIGIRPTALPSDVIQSCFVTGSPYKLSYNPTSKKLAYEFRNFLYNATGHNFTGKLSVVIENSNKAEDTTYLDFLQYSAANPVKPKYGYSSLEGTIEFPSNLDPGAYHLYFATLDTDEQEWQYVRTIGGAICYEMTIATNGTVAIAERPTYITKSEPLTAIREIRQQSPATSSEVRYYDLQGREVSETSKGIIIRRQGKETKKIVVK